MRVALPAARAPELVVRSAARAHGQLVRGLGPWRALTYPERGPVEDVELLVVGGGVAGLATAYLAQPRRTVVLEREDRLGGTGACAQALDGTQFALAAHYECDPTPNFGPELLGLYTRAGFVEADTTTGGHRFVDDTFYVAPERSEQSIDPTGRLTTRGFRVFQIEPEAMRLRDLVLERTAGWPMTTRAAGDEARAEGCRSFRAWLDAQGFSRGGELERRMNVLLRSDYGAPAEDISAYAGLHYFGCRPYLTHGSRTFAPSQGLSYFAQRFADATPGLELRLRQMAVRLTDHGDHVEVRALDLTARTTRRYRAQRVVVATPKKAVRFLHPPDAQLFTTSAYAAWLTVTFELGRVVPEQELLCWANHVAEPSHTHIGITWHNHASPQAPAIFSHYIALPPGKPNHVRLLTSRARGWVERCAAIQRVLFGRDLVADTSRITVQKLGHAMPTPVPGALFTNPNARRASRRILYAGVDTGRLPLLAEALDSALEVAGLL